MFDIENIKRKLLIKYPYFGSVIANVKYIEDESIDTAETDGENIYYSSSFLNSISLEQQLFTIAHEICHIAFNHILRSEGKIPKLWNIATDAVINAFLMKDGLEIIDDGINIPEAINYDAEQLYEKLLNEMDNNSCHECNNASNNKSSQCNYNFSSKNEKSNNNSKDCNSASNESNQKLDSHNKTGNNDDNLNDSDDNVDYKTEDNLKNNKDSSNEIDKKLDDNSNKRDINDSDSKDNVKEAPNEQNSDGNLNETDNKAEEKSKNNNHNLWSYAVKKHKEEQENQNQNSNNQVKTTQQEIEKVSEKDAFRKNRDEKKKQLNDIKRMIIEETYEAGEDTNHDIFNIGEVGTIKPIIDWRYVLKTNFQFDYDWSYKNSYIEDGVISATLEEQPFSETEILLDTSGSIDEVMLRNFIMECKNILKVSRLKIGCFDTKFYGFNEIRSIDDLKNMEFVGRGGTDFNCAVNAFSNRVDNRIIFTDGYSSMPKKTMDIVWMVYGNRKINPNGGCVYYVSAEQLERLCCVHNKVKTLRK